MEDQLVINSATPLGNGMFYWELDTNQGKFFYTPAEFVNKGAVTDKLWVPEANDYAPVGGIQFFEPGFLNNPDVVKNAKPVLLQDNILTGAVTKLNLFENPNQGILMTPDQAKKVLGKDYDTWVEKREFPWFNQNVASSYSLTDKNPNTGQPLGRITGLGVYNGNPVYSRETEGGYTSSFINPGQSDYDWTVESTWKKCGIFGCSVSDALGDIAQAFGEIPFLTEATAFIPGVGPAIYGALKGTQAGMAGKDPLETAFKVGASVFLQQQAFGGTQSPAPIVDATYAAGAPVIESLTAVPAIETLLSSGLAAPTVDALYSAGSSATEGLIGAGPAESLLSPEFAAPITDATYAVGAPVIEGVTGTVPGLLDTVTISQIPAQAGMGGLDITSAAGQGATGFGSVADVGYLPEFASPTVADVGFLPEFVRPEVADVGFVPSPGTSFANGVQIDDISVPFDPAAYEEFAGLSGALKGIGNLAMATGETLLSGVKNDPAKALGIASVLGGGQETPSGGGGGAMVGGGGTARGVDYSSLLSLLQGRARTPGLLGVQFRPQAADLSQLYRSSLLG